MILNNKSIRQIVNAGINCFTRSMQPVGLIKLSLHFFHVTDIVMAALF